MKNNEMMTQMMEMMKQMSKMMEMMSNEPSEPNEPMIANALTDDDRTLVKSAIKESKKQSSVISASEWAKLMESPKKIDEVYFDDLEMMSYKSSMCVYNHSIPQRANGKYINEYTRAVVENYGGKLIKYQGKWVYSFSGNLDAKRAFLANFQIKQDFTDEEKADLDARIKKRKIERDKAQLERLKTEYEK